MDKHHLRALLIEDDDADCRLITRSLHRSHLSIELVRSKCLADGLCQLAATGFDLVLTDLSLPDSFGLDTVTRINDQHRDLPIIVLTTLDDHEIELQSLTMGAQDYLLKDEAAPHALERAIHHAIQRHENTIEIQQLLAEVESQREVLLEQKELLKRKNQRLRRLYKTAQRFVDNVSHEFRTPLTVIKDYVSLVREGIAGEVNAEQCRMLDIANVRTDDLNNMVDDMLDVSKLESGLFGVWRRPCRLADIVEAVCPPLRRKAELREIGFEVAVEKTLPTVYCDADQIGRVIINLITNAIKFCGEPGTVRLWAREMQESDEIVVGVTDNGPGIDEAMLAEIFKRFKQLKTQLKNSTKGFGLGLNIAKELVDLNLGDISVESQVGQGTTFSFTVPLDSPPRVMQRYLERIQRLRHGASVLALVQAQIDASHSDANAEDVDAFFNYLLRRNDLLFRMGHQGWLFVLPMPRSELPDFLARVESEREKTNRNRPFGPLPRFEMSVVGAWSVQTESDEILDRVTGIMQPEAAYA